MEAEQLHQLLETWQAVKVRGWEGGCRRLAENTGWGNYEGW